MSLKSKKESPATDGVQADQGLEGPILCNGNGLVTTAEQLAFEEFRERFWKVIGLFGSILSLPIVVAIALAHGVRAGIVVMLRKTLSMLESWEGEE